MTENIENKEQIPEEEITLGHSAEALRFETLRGVANDALDEEERQINSRKAIPLTVCALVAIIGISIFVGERINKLYNLIQEHQLSSKLFKAEKERIRAEKDSKKAEKDKKKAEEIINEIKQDITVCSTLRSDNIERWGCLASQLEGRLNVKSDKLPDSLDEQISEHEEVITNSRERIERIKGYVLFCEKLWSDEKSLHLWPEEELKADKWKCFKDMADKLTRPRKKTQRQNKKLQTKRKR